LEVVVRVDCQVTKGDQAVLILNSHPLFLVAAAEVEQVPLVKEMVEAVDRAAVLEIILVQGQEDQETLRIEVHRRETMEVKILMVDQTILAVVVVVQTPLAQTQPARLVAMVAQDFLTISLVHH